MNFRINKNNLALNLSTISFLLLFPGFFSYHFAIGKGFMPPFIGGYFGVVAAAIFVPLIAFNYRIFLTSHLPIIVFTLILIVNFIVTIVHFSLQLPVYYTAELFVWSVTGLLFNVVAFLVAARLRLDLVSALGFFIIVAMFFVVALNIGDDGIFYLKQEAGANSDSVATYQGFARSIVVVLLVSVGVYFEKGFKFYLIVILGAVALFFNGARAEFALIILTLAFLYLMYSMVSIKIALSFLGFVFLAVFIVMNIVQLLPDSRMLQLFDIASSSSAQARSKLLSFGWQQISDNPVFGSYGSYTVLGGIGYGPHNIISSWLNLGLIGFSLYFLLFYTLWKDALLSFLKHRENVYYRVFLVYLVFVTGAILVSKDYSYMLIGLLVGFYYQYKKI